MSVGMSKLETLIQQLCPDGVAIVQLKEVAHYSKTRIDATEVSCDNYVGVENLLQNKLGKNFRKYRSRNRKKNCF